MKQVVSRSEQAGGFSQKQNEELQRRELWIHPSSDTIHLVVLESQWSVGWYLTCLVSIYGTVPSLRISLALSRSLCSPEEGRKGGREDLGLQPHPQKVLWGHMSVCSFPNRHTHRWNSYHLCQDQRSAGQMLASDMWLQTLFGEAGWFMRAQRDIWCCGGTVPSLLSCHTSVYSVITQYSGAASICDNLAQTVEQVTMLPDLISVLASCALWPFYCFVIFIIEMLIC